MKLLALSPPRAGQDVSLSTWLVIDSVSFGLYFTRRLYLTMLLFGLYLVLIVVGMRQWRRSLISHATA